MEGEEGEGDADGDMDGDMVVGDEESIQIDMFVDFAVVIIGGVIVVGMVLVDGVMVGGPDTLL